MPGDSGVLVVARVRSTTTKCTRDRGCNGHPAFPTPSKGRKINARLGRFAPRGGERAFEFILLLESSKSMCVRSAPQARSSKRKLLLSREFDNFFHRLCGTRASNRVCSSKRTFRFPGWRCFRRPATSSISRSRRCSTKRWSAPGAGGSGSMAAARSCLAACLRIGPRRQSVALAQSGRLRAVGP
jgi:hypothetical protein